MPTLVRFTVVCLSSGLLVGCATNTASTSRKPASSSVARRIQKVRTTAYCGSEGTGHRNAIGGNLTGGGVKSAASDWSRFPLGTRFQIVGTKDIYEVDDYGGALIGTNTIDLYKSTRSAMRIWGVRHIDIEILQWGSDEKSLRLLRTRRRARRIDHMVVALEEKARKVSTLKSF